jgi:mono/diheme cytochrome c family protein
LPVLIAHAAVTPQERTSIADLAKQVQGIRKLLTDNQTDQAVVELLATQQAYDQLATPDASPDLRKQLAKARSAILQLRKRLEREGKSLEPWDGEIAKPASSEAVAFTRDVAPLLVSKCGGCHIERNRGGLSLSSYVALAKGSENGPVVVPGSPQQSRLIEVLTTGEMPPNGDPMPQTDIAKIAAWISAGATFDGRNPAAPLVLDAPQTPTDPNAAATPEIARPSGKETISFAGDIAPILVANCTGCHGATQGSAQLRMHTIVGLMTGGASGSVIEPGKPDESLLIAKLQGTAPDGQRMPLRRAALEPDQIVKLETWIREGATFDGSDPAERIESLANRHLAASLSPDELAQHRAALATAHWTKALPDLASNRAVGTTFLVMGNDDVAQLEQVARAADTQTARVAKALKVPPADLLPGPVTLYLFHRRTDYSEFALMVEERELPREFRNHWHHDVLDPYFCILAADEAELNLALIETITGLYLESLGDAPRWYREGTAQALASKLDPKSPVVHSWDNTAQEVLTRVAKPEEFLTGGLVATENRALAYSFAKYLLKSGSPAQQLLKRLQDRESFADAFAAAYKKTPEDLIPAWTQQALAKRK